VIPQPTELPAGAAPSSAAGPVLPEGDPLLTIPLDGLEPSSPQPVELAAGEPPSPEAILGECRQGDALIQVYTARDGTLQAALVPDGQTPQVFSTLPPGTPLLDLAPFRDLLGRDGFYLEYDSAALAPPYVGQRIRAYYCWDEAGDLVLLARCYPDWGGIQTLDMDGDGVAELVTPWQIFTLQGGQVYELWPEELLSEAAPGLAYYTAYLSPFDKLIHAGGETPHPQARSWNRLIAFTGDSLLVYSDDLGTRDHLTAQARQQAPQEVLAAAQDALLSRLEPQPDGTWRQEGSSTPIDDWRITYLSPLSGPTAAGAQTQAWSFYYELHTPDPEGILLSASGHLTEDNWYFDGYPYPDILFFQVAEDGSLQYLYTGMSDSISG